MPDDVQADHREDVGLRVVVADDDVARQVHDARHHRKARECGDHGRRHARPPQDLPQRRGRSHRGHRPARAFRRLQLERDRPRVGADVEGEEQARPVPSPPRRTTVRRACRARSPCPRRAAGRRGGRAPHRRARRRGRTRSRAPSARAGPCRPRRCARGALHHSSRPTPAKPRTTSGALSNMQPSAVAAQPTAPITKPPAMTGTRPSDP